MHSSLFHSMTRAGLALLVSSFLLPAGADAAPIREVSVSVTGAGGMPPAVEKRITASISAIGNRILVGKDESLFRSHESEYDKVLADIVNRVVVGYLVDDISASYGEKTALHVSLTPVGQMIREVETEIDYGNLSPEAAAHRYRQVLLLIYLPVLLLLLLQSYHTKSFQALHQLPGSHQ